MYEQLRAEIRNEAFSEYISDLISLIVYDYPQKRTDLIRSVFFIPRIIQNFDFV